MPTLVPSSVFSIERLACLQRALSRIDGDITRLAVMPDTGLAHDHVWLSRESGCDWVARLPKQSQMQLSPEANLAYQADCFERATATESSGETADQ